ncbi:hypothetical protein GN244_ATG11163 [Phytophthora infestans]|uniref:Uncharacterized protein n=1 Tax=Phytophthora infestans TaxID=4787 RepID=A0A833T0K3_PHYIN|nr:hypothetical protein GN244_ATG11163 [Phytophthora infestans]KAF4141274.1 hypothetical protein GN958_ATG09539 [Phytophthora infestans]
MLPPFESEEVMSLARAWIAVASGPPAEQSVELFWKQVGSEYAGNMPPTVGRRTVDELQRQWQSMRPSTVAFVTLFSQRYRSSTDASLSLAFEWAVKTFRVATKREFEYVAVAWLLVNQATY